MLAHELVRDQKQSILKHGQFSTPDDVLLYTYQPNEKPQAGKRCIRHDEIHDAFLKLINTGWLVEDDGKLAIGPVGRAAIQRRRDFFRDIMIRDPEAIIDFCVDHTGKGNAIRLADDRLIEALVDNDD